MKAQKVTKAGWVDRESRSPAWVKVQVESGAGLARGLITDISIRGCRIRSGKSLQCGEKVRVRVPGVGAFGALVRWSKFPYAGAEFLPGSESWDREHGP